ncbi:MAG TPA: GntR family transcriptional regulator [Bacilli bacterium]
MGEEFSGTAPIYYQIVQKICSQIVRGELLPGDKLPSVRDLAIQLGVNPNTVQRVYMELEQLALAESRRGQGTYVTEDLSRLKQLREQLRHNKIETFVQDMKEMGFTADETANGLMEYLNGYKKGGTRK